MYEPGKGRFRKKIGDKMSDATHSLVNQVKPRRLINKVRSAKQGLKNIKEGKTVTQQRAKRGIKNIKDTAKKTKQGLKDLKNDPKKALKNLAGFGKEKASNSVKKAYNNFKEKHQRFKRFIETIKKIAQFMMAYGKYIAIATAVVTILFNAVIFGISIAQGVAKSPHYYCDMDAPASVKKSSVFKQYCINDNNSWGVNNINGHYIVQDGEGPATACAFANMMLRYYSIEENDLIDVYMGNTNVYSYLWQADGKYTTKGHMVSDEDHASATIRQVLNDFSTTGANNKKATISTNDSGSRNFAKNQGIDNYNMSNWGYLRDSSIDLKSYEQTDDYYDDQSKSAKWVWDLSLNNQGAGTTWNVPNDWDKIEIVLGENIFRVESLKCPSSESGYKLFINRLNNVLEAKQETWYEYYKSTAGVILQYTKTASGVTKKHTILITKREVDPNDPDNSSKVTYYGIDSPLGITGGWEGPLDGTSRFVADDVAIDKLLKSDKNEYTDGNGTKYKLTKIGYCSKKIFGFGFNNFQWW